MMTAALQPSARANRADTLARRLAAKNAARRRDVQPIPASTPPLRILRIEAGRSYGQQRGGATGEACFECWA